MSRPEPEQPVDPVRVDAATRGLIPWLVLAFVGGPLLATAVFHWLVDPALKRSRALDAASRSCLELDPAADCSRAALEAQLREYRALDARAMPENPNATLEELRAAAKDMYLLEHRHLIPLVAPVEPSTAP